jgi:hypothetical protein
MKKDLIVHIDFFDEVFIRPEVMTRDDIYTLVGRLAASGTGTIILRTSPAGHFFSATSKAAYFPWEFDVDDVRANQPYGELNEQQTRDYVELRKKHIERINEVVLQLNPLELFVRASHEANIKIIAWVDIYDFWFPGYRSKILDTHPEYQWTAKDGKTLFRGLPSYAFSEMRTFIVDMAQELLAMGFDGIHCSTSAHCRHQPHVQCDDFYGFESPVVEEYEKRYGVNIRKSDTFDKEAWQKLKGEYVNQLYQQLADTCHAQWKELWVGLQLGRHTQFSSPYFGDNAVARYYNDWKVLVDHKTVDAFVVGDYELLTSPGEPYWAKKGLGNERNLYEWAAREYLDYCRNKTKVYLFGEWLPKDREKCRQDLATKASQVNQFNFDGIIIHEAAEFEQFVPDGFHLLKEVSERL